jgi:hypothetical protein
MNSISAIFFVPRVRRGVLWESLEGKCISSLDQLFLFVICIQLLTFFKACLPVIALATIGGYRKRIVFIFGNNAVVDKNF